MLNQVSEIFIWKNLKRWVLPLASLAFAFNSMGQSPAQYMKKGDLAAEQQIWDEAFSYYKQGYLLDTGSFELCERYADAARQIKNYALAETLYDRNYQKDNGKLSPDGLFWLALMQKYNGRYEDAQRNFKKYVKKHKVGGDKALLKRAEHEAKSAVWALNYKDKDADALVENAGQSINTSEAEIAPFASDSTLQFSSTRGKSQTAWKIYHGNLSGANQYDEMRLTGIPGNYSVANLKTTIDGYAFFSVADGGRTKICSSFYADGKYSVAEDVVEVNIVGWQNTMPCLETIGGVRYLFFVSDREGGEGGMDIWYMKCENKTDEFVAGKMPYPLKFGKAKNLGSRYNTEGDELTPFVYDSLFYFSSDWHEGFGGQDIFQCAILDFVTGKPENLGRPINSSANDFYFTRFDKVAWLSSNREGSLVGEDNATCCNDIYKVIYKSTSNTSVQDQAQMTLEELNKALPVTLYFHNDEPNPATLDTTTSLSYIDAYESYLNLIPKYITENTKGLNAEKSEEAEAITSDFFELKVKQGVSDLQHFAELLLKELEKGRSFNISVRGFASPRAKTDYNLNLTKRRTASLVNYMRTSMEGKFLPYVNDVATNGAKLQFNLLPFGEVKADKSVSDDLKDEKNSIYNRSACLERKIEIESVEEIPSTIRKAVLKLDSETFDFGKINKYDLVHHNFTIRNEGNIAMQIDSVVAECGCTEPKLDKMLVLPGDFATLDIGFTPFGSKGRVTKHLTIYVAGEEPRIITFNAEIEK